MELPSIKGLQALAALQSAVSLTAAAQRLGVSRSALSHRIAELERQLGVVLVRQAGRNAVLTEDAAALLGVMGDSLERIEAAVAPLHRLREQLRVTTVATFASHWLIPRLPDWQAHHPEIQLVISTTTRAVDFEAENVDCGIRHGLGQWEGCEAHILFRETLVPVATDRHPALSATSTVIRARSRFRDWPRWWRAQDRPGRPPEQGVIVETRAQAVDAALAGVGVAMLDWNYARSHVTSGRLHRLGEIVPLQEGYFFVTPRARRRKSRAVSLLRTWLTEQSCASTC